MEKRVTRGKKTLAATRSLFELGMQVEFPARLAAVQRALYLSFNEGYHGAGASAVRTELCDEAMRLVGLLLDHPPSATPATYALGALMCLHAARSPARLDEAGDLISLRDQDRTRWDGRLVAEGRRLLDLSARGPELTDYHVEAAIAALHSDESIADDERWDRIVSLYDTLLAVRRSPVAALQRALAVAERDGAERGLDAIRAIDDAERLGHYPFYFAALGELELRRGEREQSAEHFRAALALARNDLERRFLRRRLTQCGED